MHGLVHTRLSATKQGVVRTLKTQLLGTMPAGQDCTC